MYEELSDQSPRLWKANLTEKKKEKGKELVPVKLIYEFLAKLEIDIFNSFANTVPKILGLHIR